MDVTFAHSYECEQLAEYPGGVTRTYYYPGASTVGGRDGVIVRTFPQDGACWIGTFAFGDHLPHAFSGLFTTPDSDQLCVVAKGAGYLVSASEPRSWAVVESEHITDVRPVGAKQLLVFAGLTHLVAYGREGIRWKTRRLSFDGLSITGVSDTSIMGEFWDIQRDETSRFAVDLSNGSHQGGADV